jgi:hypothetical protein
VNELSLLPYIPTALIGLFLAADRAQFDQSEAGIDIRANLTVVPFASKVMHAPHFKTVLSCLFCYSINKANFNCLIIDECPFVPVSTKKPFNLISKPEPLAG